MATNPQPIPTVQSDEAGRRFSSIDHSQLAMPASLALIGLFFGITNDDFLSPRNLSMLAIELSVTATLALGMLLVILPGHIDLAAGSGVGFIGGLSAVLTFRYGWPALGAIAVGLVVGPLIWSAMGMCITRFRIQAFIITLGGLLVIRGLFWLLIRSSATPVTVGGQRNLYSALTTTYLPAGFGVGLACCIACFGVVIAVHSRNASVRDGSVVESFELWSMKVLVALQSLFLLVLICNLYRGIPLPLLILGVLAVVTYFITDHTVLGRYLYAIGGNADAAHACGVPISRAVVSAFAFMGVCVAITGLLQTSYAGASTTTVGDLMELDAIAACVIGGASLRGGRGNVPSTLAGALVMASLLNGLTLMAVAPEIKLVIRGLVLVMAVLVDTRLRGDRR